MGIKSCGIICIALIVMLVLTRGAYADKWNVLSASDDQMQTVDSVSQDTNIKSWLTETDKSIYVTERTLNSLATDMGTNSGSSVKKIMQLDVEYRSTENSLNSAMEKRQEIMDSVNANNVQNPGLKNQQSVLATLKLYPQLGEVDNVKTPLDNRYTLISPFGWRLDPSTKDDLNFHSGIDMLASKGTAVLAEFNGVVKKVGTDPEIGNYVILDHGNGISTLYAHLQLLLVTPDQSVKQYQPIAYSGAKGSRIGVPCLYFGLYINDVAVDPELLFR